MQYKCGSVCAGMAAAIAVLGALLLFGSCFLIIQRLGRASYDMAEYDGEPVNASDKQMSSKPPPLPIMGMLGTIQQPATFMTPPPPMMTPPPLMPMPITMMKINAPHVTPPPVVMYNASMPPPGMPMQGVQHHMQQGLPQPAMQQPPSNTNNLRDSEGSFVCFCVCNMWLRLLCALSLSSATTRVHGRLTKSSVIRFTCVPAAVLMDPDGLARRSWRSRTFCVQHVSWCLAKLLLHHHVHQALRSFGRWRAQLLLSRSF